MTEYDGGPRHPYIYNPLLLVSVIDCPLFRFVVLFFYAFHRVGGVSADIGGYGPSTSEATGGRGRLSSKRE